MLESWRAAGLVCWTKWKINEKNMCDDDVLDAEKSASDGGDAAATAAADSWAA